MLIYWGPNLYLSLKNGKVGTKDDQYAQESYSAGIDLAKGYPLPAVMNQYALAMQHPDMRLSKEWPGDGIAETNCIYLLKTTRPLLEHAAGK